MLDKKILDSRGWEMAEYPSERTVYCGLCLECGRGVPCVFSVNEKDRVGDYTTPIDELEDIKLVKSQAYCSSCNANKVIENLYHHDGTPRRMQDYGEW